MIIKLRQRGVFHIKETNRRCWNVTKQRQRDLINIQELRFPIVGFVIMYIKRISSIHTL